MHWAVTTRRCKGILVAVFAVTAIIAWLIWPPPRTDLDRAVVQGYDEAVNGDVTGIAASYLPNDFNGAVRELRRLGFTAGSRIVGVIHRRQPPPEPPLVDKSQRSSFRYFNRLLDDYDAVLVRYFVRKIPGLVPGAFFRGPAMRIYLFMKEDGSMALYAHAIYPVFLP